MILNHNVSFSFILVGHFITHSWPSGLGYQVRKLGTALSDSQLNLQRQCKTRSHTNFPGNDVQYSNFTSEEEGVLSKSGIFLPMQVKHNVTEKVAQVSR